MWDDAIRRAIEETRLLGVRYNGVDRVVEPHDFGVRTGRVTLLVFQLERADARPQLERAREGAGGRITGWRLLDVGKIEACVVLDRRFAGSRGAAHAQHYDWDELYARVR